MNDWLPILKMAVPFLVLFGISEYLYRIEKIAAETTRKTVHVGTGLLTLLFPFVFNYSWQVVVICSTFLIILLLSMYYRFLPSINAVHRSTWGSVLFPVVVVIIFVFGQWMERRNTSFYGLLFYWLPLLIMAIADPMAAFAGNWYKEKYGAPNGKTMVGTLAFFVTAFFIATALLLNFTLTSFSKIFLYAMLLAFATTLAERFSKKGWDNFTIPLTAAGLLYLIA